MTPLASLVIKVAPDKAVTTPGHLGRAVYAFWLDYVNTCNADTATQIHKQNLYKPFTCSTLMGGERQKLNSQLFQPEQPAWFRITALTPQLVEILQKLSENPPAYISLDNTRFNIQSSTFDNKEHPWASFTTYEDLFSQYLGPSSKYPKQIHLEFASATGFRFSPSPNEPSRTWPVPMPTWVFGNLLRHWQSYKSDYWKENQCEALLDFVEKSVVLTRYKLETRAIPFKNDIPQMGCVGDARYMLIKHDHYWLGALQLLAAYSFYAGIGYQTTVGMGQARPQNLLISKQV